MQTAGCFSLVLECIPAQLAKEIADLLVIPTIGIGAGPFTDGQVLVYQDLLGHTMDSKPKFVKSFVDGYSYIKKGLEDYIQQISTGEFPRDEHCYQT